ncbi:MAG: hypothetical protein J6K39_01720 [Clostridia bacterium]|nr:hypothetical protein [Clostridia bacterium]
MSQVDYEELANILKEKMDKVRLLKLAAKIKPVVRFVQNGQNDFAFDDNGELYYIQPCNIRTESFLWTDQNPICKAVKLVKLAEVDSLHTYGYPLLFKPSVEECLKYLPNGITDRVVAFEVKPTYEEVYQAVVKTENGSFHKGKTTFYGLEEGAKVPEEIDNQPVRAFGDIIKKSEIEKM